MPSIKSITAIALAFSLLASLSAFAGDKPPASKEDLRRIQEQLRAVKKKSREAVRQERSVLSELERMDKSLAAKRGEVKRLENRLKEVSGEVATTESAMEDKKRKAGEREKDLAVRLRAMYMTDRAGGPWVLLASGDYGLMLKRYKYLAVMSERDRRLMDGYKGDIEELSQYKDKLKVQRAKYDALKGRRDSEYRKVQDEEGDKKDLLASIRKQKSSYESMARELEESSRRMRELLRRLEQEARERPGMVQPPAGPAITGRLDWPVNGKVISFFGRQKHPEYDTYIYKNGIEIQAPMGTEVRAVESAVVAFANWFKGLGLVAILRHGGDYYSVYAHLAELKVKAGDKVQKGEAIATLGDTGAPSGPSLYFEVRKGSEAQDPLSLLKKR
jgi:septal ring factor EnvC (AmiA/AmiB activator)